MAVLDDRALLLARTPYGESSLVATVLCASRGRVRVLAKGAYRATSRYFGVLDAFHTLELAYRPPRDEGLSLLVAGDWLVRRAAIPRSGTAYRAAWAVLETARLVARDGVAEVRLLGECERALDALESAARSGDDAAARLARVAFDLRALHNLGLAPALVHCAECGRPAPTDQDGNEYALFSPAHGGRTCRACAARSGHTATERVLVRTLLVARDLIGGAAARDCSRPELRELERLSDRFTDHHLDATRKSLAPHR